MPRSNKYSFFVGIDVSRNKLDYAVLKGKELLFHKESENNPKSISEFVNELRQLPKFAMGKSIFCMEQTGIYCNHLLTTLKKKRAHIVVENALQIKNSLGLIRGKYDKIDAIRIAHYVAKFHDDLKLWEPRRPIIESLSALNTLRNRMVGLQGILRNPLKEQRSFVKNTQQVQIAKLCSLTVEAANQDLNEIENYIDHLISNDERLNRLYQHITSVPYVGRVTAIHILISTNEFKDITEPKKFACYCGVAPFKKESGTYIQKARVSNIANKKIKALLHICSLNAIRYDAELKTYYEKKTQIEGKAKMAVINAVRNKLIRRIFACAKQDRLFTTDYDKIENIAAGELRTTQSIQA